MKVIADWAWLSPVGVLFMHPKLPQAIVLHGLRRKSGTGKKEGDVVKGGYLNAKTPFP
ncbi:hypothetical protein [Corynebacterium felinum]|uniref:hypothetical protein n=1 Tax=Corynebacterium felinum TaxID=131318 RepID=UPI0025B5E0D6|nr:hypothetical protein [Corynebacterium felinum]